MVKTVELQGTWRGMLEKDQVSSRTKNLGFAMWWVFFLTEIKDRIRKRSVTGRNVTYVGVTVRTIAVLLPDTIKYAEICLIDFVFYPSVDINIYPLNYFILIEF